METFKNSLLCYAYSVQKCSANNFNLRKIFRGRGHWAVYYNSLQTTLETFIEFWLVGLLRWVFKWFNHLLQPTIGVILCIIISDAHQYQPLSYPFRSLGFLTRMALTFFFAEVMSPSYIVYVCLLWDNHQIVTKSNLTKSNMYHGEGGDIGLFITLGPKVL